MCHIRQEFIPPLHIYHRVSHLIIYVTTEDSVEITRVPHESVSIEALLE